MLKKTNATTALTRSRKWWMLGLIIVLAFTIAACGEDDDGDDGDNGDDTEEESGIDLSEEFSATIDGVTVTFNHPADWAAQLVEEDRQIYAANSQEVLDSIIDDPDYSPSGDDIGLIIAPLPAGSLGEDVTTPAQILETFGAFMADEETTMGDVETATIGEIEAATMSMESEGLTAQLIAWNPTETFSVLVTAATENYSDYEAAVEAVVQTVEVSGEPSN